MRAAAYTFLLLTALAFGAAGCSESTDKVESFTPQQAHGKKLFDSICANCHRAHSKVPLNGPGLEGVMKKQFLPSGVPANDERVKEVIQRGKRNMPSFGPVLTEEQIKDVVAYLHTL